MPDYEFWLGGVDGAGNPSPVSLAGFSAETGDIAHQRALSWYAGTADLNREQFANGELIYRREGDRLRDFPGEVVLPWYRPVHEAANFAVGDRNAPGEGIGTGWFYSVLGGGLDLRPLPETTERVFLWEDNTYRARMRGDFAVPTLFNGNFDAIFTDLGNAQAIPGWAFYNGGGGSLLQDSLIERHSELPGVYTPGSDDNDNYALELNPSESITHNRFVVPDWGVLRFDLHVPDVEPASEGSFLRIFIQENTPDATLYELTSDVLTKDALNSPRQAQRLEGVEIISNPNPFAANYQGNRISYGSQGFETFHFDIPNALRGKVATLSFKLDAGAPSVYLDDIFFQSEHLLLGNPTEARVLFDPGLDESDNANLNELYEDNFLIERPQYTVAYSRTDNAPLWASWQLNSSWFTTPSNPRENFEADVRLSEGWYQVPPETYTELNLPELEIPGTPFRYEAGHLVPAADRDRNRVDGLSVALLSNIVPQHQKLNSPVWSELEKFSRDLVNERGRELYIIAGTGGSIDTVNAYDSSEDVNVPEYFWKIITVLEPGQGIADITEDAPVVAVLFPNELPPTGTDTAFARWHEGGGQIITVRDLEHQLNQDNLNPGTHYDFFSNISQAIQDQIENKVFTWTGNNPLNAFPVI
ncbi:MAG: hypothetical protein HC890_11165 [Chloroflexaceae bacterium]|nr:hypothetical protein [Chloroflexaceae bacterium]